MRKPVALDPNTYQLPDNSVLICAVGYERRSRFVAEEIIDTATIKLAIEFDQRTVFSFDQNFLWMKEQGFQFYGAQEDCLTACVHRAVNLISRGEASALVIDVSSMTRPMIAEIISHLSRKESAGLEVHFCYAPATFKPPQKRVPPQTYSGPVTPAYAGWASDPSKPLAAIIGAGYEYGRALGVLEYLEPTVAWLFNPTGVSDHYDTALTDINKHLYDLVPADQVLHYPVGDPLACFERVEALVYGLKDRCRVLLCPFGPKLFALICMLVAEAHKPDVTVWRVSGGQSEQPFDHEAAGMIYRLPVRFD